MILSFDRGTKNKTVTGFVDVSFISTSISAGVTLLISIWFLHALPFSDKFSVIWPASGIMLATLMVNGRKAFYYSIIAHGLAMVAARGLMTSNWLGATFTTTLELINIVGIAFILRNLNVNRYIFTNVRKLSLFLTASALLSIFIGLFSMFLPPYRWQNQVSMEWGIWVLTVIPSFWIVTPLILSYLRKYERAEIDGSLERQPIDIDARQVAISLVIGIICAVALYNIPFSFTSGIILMMVAIPLLLFAAVRWQSLPFLILLTVIGESGINHAYLFHQGFIPSHPLEMAPLITAKFIYLILSGSLLTISVLISFLGEQKGLVYRTRDEFAANFVDSHIGMFHARTDGKIERGNTSLAHLLGYSDRDEIDNALEEDPNCFFYTEEDLASFLRLIEQKYGWADAPLTLRDKKGDPIEVEVAGRPWMEANQRAFIEVIVTDLNKVVVTNHHLFAIEERFRLAAEAGGVGIWEIDNTKGKLYLNDVMERWFGPATNSLAVDLADLSQMIDPAMRVEFDRIISKINSGSDDFFEVETRAKALGLGWRVFNFTGKRLLDANDQPLDRWVGTAWDTTDEFEQRTRLNQANQKLRAESEDNRKLRDTIARSAAHDMATGLYTRNHMQTLYTEKTLLNNGASHNLLMIELRDGSVILRSVGFDKAQKIITLLGEITKMHFRSTDHVGRMNTFMLGVITDLVDEDEIRMRLNKVMVDFDAAMLADHNNTFLLRNAIATYPTHGSAWTELVNRAEELLA